MTSDTPATDRELAQLRQLVRRLRCLHPEKSKAIRLIRDDGYIEFCMDCMTVTDIYEG